MYFDIFSIVFIALFAFVMMKKGGAQALLSVVSVMVSIVVALNVYPYLSEFLHTTPLDENVFEIVYEVMEKEGMEEVSDVLSAMPKIVTNNSLLTLSGTGEEIRSQMAQSITSTIINIITFILVLIVTRLVLMLLSGALNLVTKLPLIKQVNSFLGFVCGFFVGVVALFIVVNILSVFAVGNEELALLIKDSYAVEIINNYSPI